MELPDTVRFQTSTPYRAFMQNTPWAVPTSSSSVPFEFRSSRTRLEAVIVPMGSAVVFHICSRRVLFPHQVNRVPFHRMTGS